MNKAKMALCAALLFVAGCMPSGKNYGEQVKELTVVAKTRWAYIFVYEADKETCYVADGFSGSTLSIDCVPKGGDDGGN